MRADPAEGHGTCANRANSAKIPGGRGFGIFGNFGNAAGGTDTRDDDRAQRAVTMQSGRQSVTELRLALRTQESDARTDEATRSHAAIDPQQT